MNGIISLGEALIDFIPLDPQNINYQKSPGGAPANVAVGVAKLGARSTFLGKVGHDVLGTFLIETLKGHGVNVEAMKQTNESKTGLVFVTNDETGDRSFSFFIDKSADQYLNEDDIDELLFDENKILHFGSISLISEPVRSATKKAVKLAKEKGLICSYDPNLRLGLWENEEVARETIISMLEYADVIKISEEELTFITGEEDIEAGLQKLDAYQIPLVFVTLGSEGSFAFVNKELKQIPAMKVNAVDTTGAGDAFVSGILYQLNETDKNIKELTLSEVEKMVSFASVSGGLTASTKGAMTALPTLEEVKKYL
ncbi:aminoimidazole riboside kinase [Litchfieldia salsa]|uniref:Fructokinase n=1 Tax=Litchfieldia salsa TaxID=930152 RepID=A0A1H0UP98_9BACI|nr:aminoimidazole riboside kinase [Litchfieldia salsa]SDP67768.1 fructokinase [Litchfieldia salsa]